MKRAAKSGARVLVLESNDQIAAETLDVQNRIRERAYELSQLRGHSGREFDDWLTAESEIISVPPVELIENAGVFELRFAVPGVNPSDIQVMTSSEEVLVKCYFHHEHAPDGAIVHLCDFKSATVFRSVPFPALIDKKSMRTQLIDGILHVTTAKEGKERPKRASTRKAPAKKKR